MTKFLTARVFSYTGAITFLILSLWLPLPARDSLFVAQHYTKQEHLIPMRDGVRLFTSIYSPRDSTQTYPILLMRTPYSVAPYGPNRYRERFDKLRSRYLREGIILVLQDVRGRYMSEGEFINVRPYIPSKRSSKEIDETTDTYDTVEWLIRNVPHNNGRVGVSGISYPGFYASMASIDAHPAVKATSPQAPVSKWMAGDDFFHNGAFLLPHAFNFFSAFGRPRPRPKAEPDRRFDHGTPDEYQFFLEMGPLPNANRLYLKDSIAFWNEMMQHGTWDDFWEARNILPHLRNIKPATMVVGGWFDMENLYGALHTYRAIEDQNPGNFNILVMGPWYHGQWANNDGDSLGFIHWNSKTSDFYAENVEIPFFNYHLRGEGELNLAEAIVFETGGNRWHFLDSWPPANTTATRIYLRENGGLAFEPPSRTAGPAQFDEYVSDPAKPVPYTAEITHWYNPAFPVEDQRFASRRPDVLVYRSDILTEDLTIAGPISVHLYVSTSGTDSDWIVKLIDVFPDSMETPEKYGRSVRFGGYQMLVRGDVQRGKFRNSLAKPEPFVPNQVTPVEFLLQDAFHRFKKGHRIMVHVQSSWFPMVDRNPQKFVNIFEATESDFQKATQRVFRSSTYPSHLSVRVLR